MTVILNKNLLVCIAHALKREASRSLIQPCLAACFHGILTIWRSLSSHSKPAIFRSSIILISHGRSRIRSAGRSGLEWVSCVGCDGCRGYWWVLLGLYPDGTVGKWAVYDIPWCVWYIVCPKLDKWLGEGRTRPGMLAPIRVVGE